MSFCVICNSSECDLCDLPMPTLERYPLTQDDGHEECDDEPCASCLERLECDLDALKNLEEIDGLTAYHIANHEMTIAAGKRRIARETRLAAVAEMPPPPMPLERQTNDQPINFQPPQPRCLVKNCSCEGSGTIAHLVKQVDGELVPW